jgi:23S rRNA (cytidine1920-2'-O)/16S rRNA (cytidine1409-2'-O)-methyltransferase
LKNAKSNKERLDSYLVAQGWFETKNRAQAAVMSGSVKVNGEVVTKAGTPVKADPPPQIEVKNVPYVSRGGFKLEKAAREFGISVKGRICLDAGASTGGFTDFLLQNGAAKVYAVDVGYGQLAWKLRQDSRVVVVERVNIRNATPAEVYIDIDLSSRSKDCHFASTRRVLPAQVGSISNPLTTARCDTSLYADFACADLSFISLTKVLGNIKALMHPDRQELVLLIKPQFEAGREQVPKSGVVKDREVHIEVINRVADFAEQTGLHTYNLTASPITGPAGNIEYLIHLRNFPAFDKQGVSILRQGSVGLTTPCSNVISNLGRLRFIFRFRRTGRMRRLRFRCGSRML